MKPTAPFVFLALTWTCIACTGPGPEKPPAPPNKWSDDRLDAVLEAQDHRDVATLMGLLKDTVAHVREAAAWALASVQDSASMKAVVPVLDDADAKVRSAAAFALSFTKDTMLLAQLDAHVEQEKDSTAQQVMLHAAFRAAAAKHRNDALFLISYLESDDVRIRLRAASILARSAKEQVAAQEAGLLHAAAVEEDPEVRMFLVMALRHAQAAASTDSLLRWSEAANEPIVRIAALRALGGRTDERIAGVLVRSCNEEDAGVRAMALTQIGSLSAPGEAALEAMEAVARTTTDAAVRAVLLGSVSRFPPVTRQARCAALLDTMSRTAEDPYLRARLIEASTQWIWSHDIDSLRPIALNDPHPIVRHAATMGWLAVWDEFCKKGIAPVQRDAVRAKFLKEVMVTNDPGSIALVMELLMEETAEFLTKHFAGEAFARALTVLHPIRDLESIQLVHAVIAKRDGLSPPRHVSPPFNHPIDPVKLRALKHGQRYRIVTAKGEVIIATDVDQCPGTSVAFDSLVVAGYYNGKAFHRMVPDFVVQGGCPRGDGYGGMPWTMRTEIGPKGFTAGSVGVASAGRDTESCQFFITHVATPHLDGNYTRFGEVVQGMEVVMQLEVGDVMERVERIE